MDTTLAMQLCLLPVALKLSGFFKLKRNVVALRAHFKSLLQPHLQRLLNSVTPRFYRRIKPLLPKEQTQQLDNPLHPLTHLLLSDKDAFRLTQAFEDNGSSAAVLKADIRARMGGFLMRLRNQ